MNTKEISIFSCFSIPWISQKARGSRLAPCRELLAFPRAARLIILYVNEFFIKKKLGLTRHAKKTISVFPISRLAPSHSSPYHAEITAGFLAEPRGDDILPPLERGHRVNRICSQFLVQFPAY